MAAAVGLAQVLHHRVERIAEEGHELVDQINIPFSAGEAHPRRRRTVNVTGCGASRAAQDGISSPCVFVARIRANRLVEDVFPAACGSCHG